MYYYTYLSLQATTAKYVNICKLDRIKYLKANKIVGKTGLICQPITIQNFIRIPEIELPMSYDSKHIMKETIEMEHNYSDDRSDYD